jgi:hypothetical protein
VSWILCTGHDPLTTLALLVLPSSSFHVLMFIVLLVIQCLDIIMNKRK